MFDVIDSISELLNVFIYLNLYFLFIFFILYISNRMAQSTVFKTTFNEPNLLSNTTSSGLLERRQQTASFLHQLELPSLPPLSQLLTTEVKQEQENISTAIETTAAAMATAITTTAQPLVQHQDTGTFLPTTTTAAVYDTNHVLPTEAILYNNNPLDPNMIDPPMFNLISSSLTDPQQLMIRQRQESVSSSSSDKIYSFVAIPGTNQKKRPRRRYDEIERLYHCNFPGCTKSYGTLNHLNAHVSMQQHVSLLLFLLGNLIIKHPIFQGT